MYTEITGMCINVELFITKLNIMVILGEYSV